jgi:hypothetical protein
LAAALLAVGRLGAQVAPRPELRVDVLGTAPYSPQVGGGVNLGAGYYQRIELDAGVGALQRDGVVKGVGRVDALMRLLLDPFGQRRWGLSLAGGISARYEAGDKVRPYLAGLIDLEGPQAHGVRVAYQLGFGGGVRVGVVVRRVRTIWR